MVLVQLTQFFSDTSNLLVHLSSDIADLVSEFVPDAYDLLIDFNETLVHPFFEPFDGMKEGLTLFFECQTKIFALLFQLLVVLLGAVEIHTDLTDKYRDSEKHQYRVAWRPC